MRATLKQIDYIDLLVIDLSLTRWQRNFYMTRILERPVDAPDELSSWEASKVIDQFKKWKEEKAALNAMPGREEENEQR